MILILRFVIITIMYIFNVVNFYYLAHVVKNTTKVGYLQT
jgi:hypothetical protein